jgi:hypothetical protein
MLGVKTSTGLKRLYSVHVKNDMPVTFLKGIKTVGNSCITTDIVPVYTDWMAVEFTEGTAIADASAIIVGCSSSNGRYGLGVEKNDETIVMYVGNDWNASGVYSMVPGVAASDYKMLLMRRNGYTTCGGNRVTITADVNKPDILSGFGVGGSNAGTGCVPQKCREITFYGIKLFSSTGVITHNPVPAKTNGRTGMYDSVTNEFYPADAAYDDFVEL